jgi:DNA-binding SARP family transcriptional activator/tetratricopeptide (TPR) repeat protein
MGLLSLALLGAPRVRHADVEVSFATRKALALLAYLVVEPGPHTRDRLTALFWPDSDAARGRATLRYTLAAMRRALGESADSPHLVVTRDAVGFDAASAAEVDLLALQEASVLAGSLATGAARSRGDHAATVGMLDAAAALWRGEFLEGFSLPDAPEFDQWTSVQREHWHRRAELVLEQLARAHTEAGAHADATDAAARWAAISPTNEAAHRRLMQLHLAAGDRASALRVYEGCRALLETELGARPAPETEALAERIRTAPAPATVPARGPDRGAPPAALPDGPLVGRSGEFLRLVELYQAARQGPSQLVVVRGEAGIGKTRLATEFLGWVGDQGADVLRGRAFEAGGRLPYQPLVDALRPRVERENAPEDLLSDVWLAELSRLLPELRDRYPDLPPLASDEATARTRLYETVVRLVQALSERSPVVLFVDDVQWADAASLDVLRYTARRWAESRTAVLVVLTLRSETLAESPALGDWLTGLRQGTPPAEIELGPLSLADTRDLLERLGGAGPDAVGRSVASGAGLDEFVHWLFDETGGQPFFLIETLRALLERGVLVRHPGAQRAWALALRAPDGEPASLRGFLPPGVREVVGARLARLTADTRALLSAGAVLGQGFAFEQLCRVADVPENVGLSALDAALRAHLLRESHADGQPGAYGFSHDKIRDAVYAEAGDARRRVFHRRALETLRDGTPAAELARHALAAGLDERAARFSIEAGDDAMRLLAARDALAHYEQALAIGPRQGWAAVATEARARRGRAFASVARWAEARRDFEAVLATVGDDEPERRAALLEGLSEACFWLMDVPSVHRHAAEALELAGRVGRHEVVMAARGWLGGAHGADGTLGAGIEQFEQAVGRARELGTTPPANVLTFHSLALFWLGRLEEAVERSRAGVEAARHANDASVLMYSLPHLGLSLASCGRYDEALQVFAEARRFGREYRIDNLLARAIAMSTGFRLDLGDFAGAADLSGEARELALAASWPPTVASANIDLLFNCVRRREIGRAEQLLAEVGGAVERAAGFHGWLWRLRLAEARAEIAAERGRWHEAHRLAGEAIGLARARSRRKYEAAGLHTRARALAALGRTTEAVADLRSAMRHARGMGDPALFLRVVAALLALDGDDTIAAEARAVLTRVTRALPDDRLRRSFLDSETARALSSDP